MTEKLKYKGIEAQFQAFEIKPEIYYKITELFEKK